MTVRSRNTTGLTSLKEREGGKTYFRSAPLTLGKQSMGTISATNPQANAPIGILALPRFHGPGLNRFPTKNTLMKIGMVNATKAATAAIEKIAPMATVPPNMSSVMAIPMVVLNQTAFTGV